MSENERSIDESDLHAFADGKLSPARRAVVDAYLAAHPEAAAEVFAWERQNEAIASLYDPAADEPLPARLDPRRIAAGNSAGWGWPGMAAAAVVLLALGIGGGWIGRDVFQPSDSPSELLVETAVTAHSLYVRENRHAVEVAASERQHLVSWLSNRIQAPIDPPDLSPEGFNFVGGRLLPEGLYTQAGPAAQLMYENASADRLTVYVTGALPDQETAYRFVTVAELDAFYWANAQITCTVVGDLPDAQMQVVARKVYQQLTRRPDYIPGGRT